MTDVQITTNPVAALFVIEDLRARADYWEARRELLAALRTGLSAEPSEGEVLDGIRAQMLRRVADQLHMAVYADGPTADCECRDPVCPKAHAGDEADSRRQLTETLTLRSVSWPLETGRSDREDAGMLP